MPNVYFLLPQSPHISVIITTSFAVEVKLHFKLQSRTKTTMLPTICVAKEQNDWCQLLSIWHSKTPAKVTNTTALCQFPR
jgi:hypothetical protein